MDFSALLCSFFGPPFSGPATVRCVTIVLSGLAVIDNNTYAGLLSKNPCDARRIKEMSRFNNTDINVFQPAVNYRPTYLLN